MWSRCNGISPPAVVCLIWRPSHSYFPLIYLLSTSLSTGGDPSADIRPTSGSLQFITNARRQTISLTILPDDLPEVDEVMAHFNIEIFGKKDVTIPILRP